MFRFSEVYKEKTCDILSYKRSKIGTFLNAEWRCGGGFQRGRIFVAPLWLTSLVTFLFSDKKVTLPQLSYCKKVYVSERSRFLVRGAFFFRQEFTQYSLHLFSSCDTLAKREKGGFLWDMFLNWRKSC